MHIPVSVALAILLDLTHEEFFELLYGRVASSAQLANFDQPFPAYVLTAILGADLRKLIAEIFLAAQDLQACRSKCALDALKHGHVIKLAAGLEDARHHSDKEHRTNLLGVLVLLGPEVVMQECAQPRLTVPTPTQRVEIIPDRMERVVACVLLNRLMGRILAQLSQTKLLEPYLYCGDIRVCRRSRFELGVISEQRTHEHFGAQHLVVSKCIHDRRLVFERG